MGSAISNKLLCNKYSSAVSIPWKKAEQFLPLRLLPGYSPNVQNMAGNNNKLGLVTITTYNN